MKESLATAVDKTERQGTRRGKANRAMPARVSSGDVPRVIQFGMQDWWALVPFAVGCIFFGWLSSSFGIDRSGDSWNFFRQAWTVYTPGVPHTWSPVQPHGYPVLLLLGLTLGIDETVFASFFNSLAMGSIGAITFLLLRPVTSRSVALGASLVLVLAKPFIYTGNWAMPETPSTFFFAIAVFLLVHYAWRSRTASTRQLLALALGAGLALGLGVWMRYAAAIWLPCGLAWIVLCGWFTRRRWLALRDALLAAIPGSAFIFYSLIYSMVVNQGKIHDEGSGFRPEAVVPVLKALFTAIREDVFGPLVTAYYCHHAADPTWNDMGIAAHLEPVSWVLMTVTVIVLACAIMRLNREEALRHALAPYALFPLVAVLTPLFLVFSCVTTAIEVPTARYCTSFYPSLFLTLALAYFVFASAPGRWQRLRVAVTLSALILFALLQVNWTAGYLNRVRKGSWVQCEPAGWKRNELVQWCRENLSPTDASSGNIGPLIDQFMEYYNPGWMRERVGMRPTRLIQIFEYYGYPRLSKEDEQLLKQTDERRLLFRTDRYVAFEKP